MRILIALLVFVSGCLMAYDVSIAPKGKYRIQVDGDMRDKKYARYNDAVSTAVEITLRCQGCVVYVVPPKYLVAANEITLPPVEPPIEPPIEPPVVIPPPVIPPPTDELNAYYSLALAGGELVNPMLIDDAVLPPQQVYVQWRGKGLDNVNGYCCKPPGGSHSNNDISKTGDTDFTLMLDRHAGEAYRLELYSDVWVDGNKQPGIYKNFFIDTTIELPPVDSITISWVPPTTRVDNSVLRPSDIGGYVVLVSSIEPDSKVLTFNTQETSLKIDTSAFQPGEWAVKVSAYDTTPSRECPDKNAVPYSCGGPLRSEFTDYVTVVIR